MTNFWRQERTKIPTKPVMTKIKRLIGVIKLAEKISLRLNRMAPIETGINKPKEKLKAAAGDSPKRRAEKMVPPDRETPGRMARA